MSDNATTPPAPKRPEAQVTGTGIVAMHKDDNDTAVDVAKIAADVEKARIAGNLALVKLIAMWAGGAVGAATLVAVVGLALYYGQVAVVGIIGGIAAMVAAIYYGRSFTFQGFGVKAGTTTTATATDASGTTTTTTTTGPAKAPEEAP